MGLKCQTWQIMAHADTAPDAHFQKILLTMGDSLMGDKPISGTAQAKPGMLNKLFFSFFCFVFF